MKTDFRGLWILAGAWVTAYMQPPFLITAIVLLLFLIIFALLLRRRHDAPSSAPWFTGPLLLLLASISVSVVTLGQDNCQLPEGAEQQRRVVISFTDQPRLDGEGMSKGIAQIIKYWDKDRWIACPTPVYLSLPYPLQPGADEFETILDLQSTGTKGAFAWWAKAKSEPVVQTWQEPTPADYLKSRFTLSVKNLPDEARGLLPGMLYGDRSGQSEELSAAMKDSGLSHLTAVSGSNVALLGAMALVILRLLSVPRVPAALLSIGFLALFIWFVGPDPSVLRAGLMGIIATISLMLGRGRGSLGILSLSGTVLLLIDPSLAVEPAFALSVLATLGIIVLTPAITEILSRVFPIWFAQLTAICCAAQFTCLPVIIALNSNFSLYSLPVNLLVAPLLPLITSVGVICLLFCTPLPAVADILLWVPGLPACWIGKLALWVIELPGASRPWPPGIAGIGLAVGFSVVFAVLLLSTYESEHASIHRLAGIALAVVVVLLAAMVLPATLFYRPAIPVEWNVAMCDVGQGDAFVIHTGPDEGWLLDAGPPDGGVAACVKQLGIQKLSKVFITHEHADHFGGFAEVEATGLQIDERLVSTGFDPSRWPGTAVLKPGDSAGTDTVHYRVIGPNEISARYAEPNDTSLVIVFDFLVQDQVVSFFTAGDLEEEAMHQLLSELPQPPVQVLKASHHGARNGGTEIIEKLKPRVLLISVGKDNSYGHPHQEILDAAQRTGTRVIRSDLEGTVLLTFEPGNVLATAIGPAVR
ncbi:ComEC/Rec2 family competence protein [Glutamicibacter arilaitensis]|uniref:ComEC/Rec2 family competence protein n=1 Tax=Glutamicibacter arilaitensis TaxID=256701 RepID=UPI00384DC581